MRALVEAGLSTRMIKIVLNIEASPPGHESEVCSRTSAEELARELRVVENRIVCLEKSREAVIEYIQSTGHVDLLSTAAH